MQKNAAVSHDKALFEWKDSIVHTKMKARLLEEILPEHLDDTVMDVCTYEDTDILSAISLIKEEKLPKFR